MSLELPKPHTREQRRWVEASWPRRLLLAVRMVASSFLKTDPGPCSASACPELLSLRTSLATGPGVGPAGVSCRDLLSPDIGTPGGDPRGSCAQASKASWAGGRRQGCQEASPWASRAQGRAASRQYCTGPGQHPQPQPQPLLAHPGEGPAGQRALCWSLGLGAVLAPDTDQAQPGPGAHERVSLESMDPPGSRVTRKAEELAGPQPDAHTSVLRRWRAAGDPPPRLATLGWLWALR